MTTRTVYEWMIEDEYTYKVVADGEADSLDAAKADVTAASVRLQGSEWLVSSPTPKRAWIEKQVREFDDGGFRQTGGKSWRLQPNGDWREE